MSEEIGGIISNLEDVIKIKYGELTSYQGYFFFKEKKIKITLA